jgi:surface antigen
MPVQLGAFTRDDRAETGPDRAAAAGGFSRTDVEAASAVTQALVDHDEQMSGPWHNPLTGARGIITPVATTYQDGGYECRDFLASYVRAGTEIWMHGEACRSGAGRWVVRNLKPWSRPTA